KVIHYCWFGKNPKPKLILKCIESWKKYCPDYEIKEWNEDNFDVNCCNYVKEAYAARKWAFVSDYCRFYVLYHYGGIYLDTDVELLKPLDKLSENFVGFESKNRVNSGLIRGAVSGDIICKLMLDSYKESSFLNPDGSLNLLTVCDRETDILCAHGMKKDNTLQIIDGTTVYPSEYFNPMDLTTEKIKPTNKTVSIHHYAASWVSKNERMRGRIAKWIYLFFGKDTAEKIRKLLGRKGKK
ncbi:MAG: glycosyl transferase, partial [Prolixibacteraceae bacterium]|nr:glycosyl transferase [Prolixibacteraceae bacterium]